MEKNFSNCKYSRHTKECDGMVGMGTFCAYDAVKLNNKEHIRVIDTKDCKECIDFQNNNLK